jgi:hypothetical protein
MKLEEEENALEMMHQDVLFSYSKMEHEWIFNTLLLYAVIST